MYKYQALVIILTQICFISNCFADNYCKTDNKDCVVITQCFEANELIRTKKFDPEVIQLFQSSTCGQSRRRDCILCSKIKSKLNVTEIINPGDVLPPFDKCGLNTAITRIFHGEIAELEDYPWIALFKYKNISGHVAYRCHGSLISERYVITAKHCLELNDKNKEKKGTLQSVVLGEYDTSTSRDCVDANYCADPLQEFSVDKFRVFTSTNGEHSDIAVIRLNGRAKFTDFVKPICLPFNFSNVLPYEKLYVAGWGKTENKTASTVKRKTSITALTANDCYQRTYLNLDNSEMCAGSNRGHDTCFGDSGGPLMAQRIYNREQKTFLVGVVAYGKRCGSTAAIYTNVFKFRDWILEVIKIMENS